MGLLAALGDSGHPFAKVETRRVEIDKDTETMAVTYTSIPGRSCTLARLRSRGSSGSIPPMSRGAFAGRRRDLRREPFRANFRRPDFLAVDQDFLATAEIGKDTPVASIGSCQASQSSCASYT
jgi:hypothetical protein